MAKPHGYHVVIVSSGNDQTEWEWEICRGDQPLGARLREGKYKSQSTAELAGRVALSEFLELLDKEKDA
jgi:hypothetical protein